MPERVEAASTGLEGILEFYSLNGWDGVVSLEIHC